MVFGSKQFLIAALAVGSPVLGHNIVNEFIYNGQTTDSCLRVAQSTDPITDLAGSQMACNNAPNAASKCAVKGGDQVAFQWSVDPNAAPQDVPSEDGERVGVTDTSHKGPCAVYMKKVDDASSAEATGDGWFKVSEDGVDGSGQFCSTRLREADAPQEGVIPSNIAPGDYLLRAEMLTLNNAGSAEIGGEQQPQFYVGCVQVTVEGTTESATPEEVSIPGYLTIDSPGLIYDIWNTEDYSDYVMPGPSPLEAGTGNSSSSTGSTTSAAAPSSTSSGDDDTMSILPVGSASVVSSPTSSREFESASEVDDSQTEVPVASSLPASDPVDEVPASTPSFSFVSGGASASSNSTGGYGGWYGHGHRHRHSGTGNAAYTTEYAYETVNPTTFVTVTAADSMTTVYMK